MNIRWRSVIVVFCFTLVDISCVYAQSVKPSFRSTSSMPLSGSSLPMAASTGATAVGDKPLLSDRNNSQKAAMFDPFGGEVVGSDNPIEPNNTPIGDPVLPLSLMAFGFAIYRKWKG